MKTRTLLAAIGRDSWLALTFMALGALLGMIITMTVIINTTCIPTN